MTRKNRVFWYGAAGLVAAALVVVGLFAFPRAPEWTTRSPEALAELHAALDASAKLYHADAERHLRRALELDPNFVAAKLLLADEIRHSDQELASQLVGEVVKADVGGLRPRERLLVERARALHDHQMEEADRLLDDYLKKHPDDPIILIRKCNELFGRNDLEDAEKMYRRLLDIDPNQVIAYNQLGYVTMIEGRFSEAEEYFTSYRFIAPDQANPYDSLGELYLIQGRYDEAETSFERALEIKPNFWDSYSHLVLARGMMGDFEGASRVVDRLAAQDGYPKDGVSRLRCVVDFWPLRDGRRWADILAKADSSDCLRYQEGLSFAVIMAHRAACELGEWRRAEEIEAEITAAIDHLDESGAQGMSDRAAQVAELLTGTRLALQGKLEEAAASLRTAEDALTYRESGEGLTKLETKLMLAEVLRASGHDDDAAALLAQVRSVNPSLAAKFERAGSKVLGLTG